MRLLVLAIRRDRLKDGKAERQVFPSEFSADHVYKEEKDIVDLLTAVLDTISTRDILHVKREFEKG